MAEEETDWSKARKYHEGWAHHQPVDRKDWVKFWVVLRGRVLFIFKNSHTNNVNSHVGTLSLGPDTEIRNLEDSNKKKGWKFELVTTSYNGQKKINRFKFDKENERDLWKSYIVGISLGVVPKDVHILPGQLKDVMEAIGDHQGGHLPLPTLPRVPIHHRAPGRGGTSRSSGSGGSEDSGSFRSHLTTRTQRQVPASSDTIHASSNDGSGTVNNLRQLYRRQADLAYKALGDEDDNGNFPTVSAPSKSARSHNNDSDDDGSMEQSIVWSEFSFGKPDEKMKTSRTDERKMSRTEERKVDQNPLGHLFQPAEKSNAPINVPESPPVGGPTPPRTNSQGTLINFARKREPSPPQPRSYERQTSQDSYHRDRSPSPVRRGSYGRPPSPPLFNPPPSPPTLPPPVYPSPHVSTLPRAPSPPRNTLQRPPSPSRFTLPRAPSPPHTLPRAPSPPRTIRSMSPVRGPYGLYGVQSPDQDMQPAETYTPMTLQRMNSTDTDDYMHFFYQDSRRNHEHPSWFFEGCSREAAESILTLGKQYGNVLMRESVTFKSTGSYVISMRREVQGGTQLSHYEVRKTSSGFKINVDNRHSPMSCLDEVVRFFVQQAGPGTRPMSTNDLSRLGVSTIIKTGRRTTGKSVGDNDSGFDDPFDDNPAPAPAAPTWDSHTVPRMHDHPPQSWSHTTRQASKLSFSGSVPPEMREAAHHIEYDFRKRPDFGGGRVVPPSPPAPPPMMGGPPPPPPMMGGGPPPPPPMPMMGGGPPPPPPMMGGGPLPPPPPPPPGGGPPPPPLPPGPSLNTAVPARSIPSQTLDRNANTREDAVATTRDSRVYYDEVNDPPEQIPPPLPPGHPAMGFPTAPQPGAWRKNSYSSQPSEDSSNQNFSTIQPPRQAGPSFGGGMSFEDELSRRLVGQREQIYAEGAKVFTNY